MTDTMGTYVGGGSRYLSPQVIKKMKKNMRKVPIIQEKSEQYHEKEEQEAESLIDEQLENTEEGLSLQKTQTKSNGEKKDENVFENRINSIKRWMKELL